MMEQEALATPPLQRRIPPRPRKRRAASLLFPTGSEFVAEFLFTIPIQAPSGMSIPVILDVPYKFALPNITDDKDPFLWGLPRADDRHTFYGLIETVFDKFGINGKECLLRAVCEGSQSSILGIGILGEVITALLTASSSSSSDLMHDYVEAEYHGRSYDNCNSIYPACPVSLFRWLD
ncbi:hypothetical protein OTU49_003909 [Cherax quadricarinatus]